MPTPAERLTAALTDRYRIERELGAGGMATVYLAHDLKHDRKVAVKVLRPELATALGPERFLREIRTTAALHHPNILTLIDSGEAAGYLYYVMAFVPGESLRARLQREGALLGADAVSLILGAGSALDFAHRHGVNHRDVKPANVLIHEGVPMVADFGIALAISDAGAERLTETGFSLGTPAYMSPAQVTGIRVPDGRSDQYSLACVLYEMLTGAPPFTAPTAQGVFVKHVTEAVPPLRGARGEVASTVARAIERALAKDPAGRFGSMGDFTAALGPRTVTAAAPREKSIVVLPFTNLSPDPANDYFGDGLTEELITDLSKVRELRVIARNSAMRLKGTTMDAPTLGRELKVRYVLGGSVRRAGNDLRINAQLSDTADDRQIWAEKYSGTFDHIFDLQERLSREIVAALRVTLTTDEHRALAERPIKSPQAYEYYGRARVEMSRFSVAAYDRAVAYLQQAEEIEGGSCLLSATLGVLYFLYRNNGMETSFDPMDLAEQCLAKAERLEPDSPYVTFLAAMIETQAGRFVPALRRLSRVLEQVPGHADALTFYAITSTNVGALDLARTATKRCLSEDPLTSLVHQIAGIVEHLAGCYADALPHFDTAARLEPENWDARIWQGWALAECGSRAEARDVTLLAAEHLSWSSAFSGTCRMFARGLDGDAAGVAEMETPAVLDMLARSDPLWTLYAAPARVLVGRLDDAVDWLERVVARGFWNYPLLATDPLLAGLRGFARYEQLLVDVKAKWESAMRDLADLRPLDE